MIQSCLTDLSATLIALHVLADLPRESLSYNSEIASLESKISSYLESLSHDFINIMHFNHFLQPKTHLGLCRVKPV